MAAPDTNPMVRIGDITSEQLRAFRSAGRVAWDTETTGLDPRSARLATCQLWSPEVGVAIVQMAEARPTNLAALLADADVIKVFHHAPFDLGFLRASWGGESRSVRCTKVASKLLRPKDPNSEHSLAPLLRRYIGVRLEKGSVRTSNWAAEELTEEQITYAAKDVLYLLDLLDVEQQLLAEDDLLNLYEACCQFLPWRAQLDLRESPDVFGY